MGAPNGFILSSQVKEQVKWAEVVDDVIEFGAAIYEDSHMSSTSAGMSSVLAIKRRNPVCEETLFGPFRSPAQPNLQV